MVSRCWQLQLVSLRQKRKDAREWKERQRRGKMKDSYQSNSCGKSEFPIIIYMTHSCHSEPNILLFFLWNAKECLKNVFYTSYNPIIWAVIFFFIKVRQSPCSVRENWEKYGLITFPCFSLHFSRSFPPVVSLSHPLFRSTPCCFHFSVPFILSFKILIIFWVICFIF